VVRLAAAGAPGPGRVTFVLGFMRSPLPATVLASPQAFTRANPIEQSKISCAERVTQLAERRNAVADPL
jgi:hypothetical protein